MWTLEEAKELFGRDVLSCTEENIKYWKPHAAVELSKKEVKEIQMKGVNNWKIIK